MLDQIKKNIQRIQKLGATYVDTRWYPYEETNSLTMWNGNLKDASARNRKRCRNPCAL